MQGWAWSSFLLGAFLRFGVYLKDLPASLMFTEVRREHTTRSAELRGLSILRESDSPQQARNGQGTGEPSNRNNATFMSRMIILYMVMIIVRWKKKIEMAIRKPNRTRRWNRERPYDGDRNAILRSKASLHDQSCDERKEKNPT